MPSKKITKTRVPKSAAVRTIESPTGLPAARLFSSYTSLLYGVITVFVLFLIIVFGFRVFSSRDNGFITEEAAKISSGEEINQKGVHTVLKGETLWSISEKYYKTGYEWKRIADANNLKGDFVISEGTKLTIPEMPAGEQGKLAQAQITPTIQPTAVVALEVTPTVTGETVAQSKIEGNSYEVVRGDTLWSIAVRAYGDGYKWSEIAKANNLDNPNIIHSGNKFTIPR